MNVNQSERLLTKNGSFLEHKVLSLSWHTSRCCPCCKLKLCSQLRFDRLRFQLQSSCSCDYTLSRFLVLDVQGFVFAVNLSCSHIYDSKCGRTADMTTFKKSTILTPYGTSRLSLKPKTSIIWGYLDGLKAGRGNLGGVWHVDGSKDVGRCPSMKKSALLIWSSEGLDVGARVSRQQMRSRADIETWGGIVNLLLTIRMYVSFSVDVSNGGRPHSSAYLP